MRESIVEKNLSVERKENEIVQVVFLLQESVFCVNKSDTMMLLMVAKEERGIFFDI